MITVLPNALYTAAHARELDRIATEEFDIPGEKLMERAGKVAYECLRRELPDARRPIIVCGQGNNAGDGFIVARLAKRDDLDPRVLMVGEPQRLQGDALTAYQRMRDAGVVSQAFNAESFIGADVVIDALLGTGLDRAVVGHYADAIDTVNASEAPVLAIDIPSGLHADTGRVLGTGVRAAFTVTFIGLKQGLFTGQAREMCGQIEFNDLDVPSQVYAQFPPDAEQVGLERYRAGLSRRPRTAHKGDFGHVLIVGGDRGFAGAAGMAGEAAARSGAGLVSLATRDAHATSFAGSRPELMCQGIGETAELLPLLERATVIAIGPGLGRGEWGNALLEAVLDVPKPMVVDADALNLLADRAKAGKTPPAPRVLTPHPAEAARLLGVDTKNVESDRFSAVKALHARYRSVAVLKGAGTLVYGGEGGPFVCAGGNPGMATGGMGDILTGIIAALLAQGFSPVDAGCLGACLHAAAGDRAARDGERGLLATDLLPHLRTYLNPT